MRNPIGHHQAEPQQHQAPHGGQYPPPGDQNPLPIQEESVETSFKGVHFDYMWRRRIILIPIGGSPYSQASVGASHGVPSTRGEQSSFYPPQANVEPQGHLVRVHCEANPEFFLAARGDIAVLALENSQDPHQQWIKVDSRALPIKDEAGFPAFALVNKATRHALKHGDKEWDQIYLADYNHEKAEQSDLWTLSADVGNGYQCLSPVNNINLNMDAKAADGHVGGIRDGNELILFEWKKQSNQKWKLQPVH